MAIQSFFFDAVLEDGVYDRVYNSGDFSNYLDQIVGSGVFPNPSSNLQVRASSPASMTVVVGSGTAWISGHKMISNSDLPLTIDAADGSLNRIDLVIMYLDMSSRTMGIEVKKGTASSSPVAPSVTRTSLRQEYALARINVNHGATSIGAGVIQDTRASADCGYVAGLIQQLDTSTLFQQWTSVYNEYYSQVERETQDFIEEQEEVWQAWFDSLSQDLTAVMNVITFTNTVTISVDGQTNIPIGIPSFDYMADSLEVYINGLFAADPEWTLADDHTSIDLAVGMDAGNVIGFRVLKAVSSANVESVTNLVRRVDQKVDAFMSDTGWIELPLPEGVTAYTQDLAPAVRGVGNRVYLRGSIKGVAILGSLLTVLPAWAKPVSSIQLPVVLSLGSTYYGNGTVMIGETGNVTITAFSGSLTTGMRIPLDSNWLAASDPVYPDVFTYMGTVATTADLPSNAMAGDVYTVSADGNQYVWNGSSWDLYSTPVTEAEIDAIINSIS